MAEANIEKERAEKAQVPTPKAFMADGPTLHYSHDNVIRFWMLSLVVYALACMCWSMILYGTFGSFNFGQMVNPESWRLSSYVIRPLSIFAYPWQITVLGLLMGMLAVMPPLAAQLLSFRYSLPFLLALAVLANLPAFAVLVLISCIAAACRPLRFRSRFIAIALCMAPQLFYWAYFGGLRNAEPIKWGFSFAPWVFAWLAAMTFAGIVLAIGHFTRYRPGICWLFGLLTLMTAAVTLKYRIGFDELAYQRYIAGNNPETAAEFRDNINITETLDATIRNPEIRRHFKNLFYPTETVLLRQRLKQEIQNQLSNDRWPEWFKLTDELNFGAKRQWLLNEYEQFITYPGHWWMPKNFTKKFAKQRARSKRMPTALYYKALLSETMPDLMLIMENETLDFYNDYPHWQCRLLWYRLYEQFPNSAESLEARLRLATYMAGIPKFKEASQLLEEIRRMTPAKLSELEQEQAQSASSSIFSSFTPPPASAMTVFKLKDIQRRADELADLISPENYTMDTISQTRLAMFVMLNHHSLEYSAQLESLLSQTNDKDPLRDNLLLAKIKLIKDRQLQAQQLKALHQKYEQRDGGIAAMYELAMLTVRLSEEIDGNEQKNKCLADAKNMLEYFISSYPKSYFVSNAQTILKSLRPSQQ